MKSTYLKRFYVSLIAICTIFCIGTIGYRLIEGWSTFDSLYMTTITLATVGYGETHELSVLGRSFTMVLILVGMGIVGYTISIMTSFIVEGELKKLLRGKKMEKKIARMNQHTIVCGAGTTGRWIIEEMIKTEHEVVVIDPELSHVEYLDDIENAAYIIGDASRDAILLSAGIERAKGLISALSDDKDNLFVVLTARELNPNLKIFSRVIDPESEKKLTVAGADGLVNPNKIGGLRMASMLLRPTVVNFLDTMLRVSKGALRVEEATIGPDSELVNSTLKDAHIPERTGLLVVAIKKRDESSFIYNPPSHYILTTEDVLIVMGEYENVNKLKKIAKSPD